VSFVGPHGLLPEPAGRAAVLRRRPAGNSAPPSRHSLRDRRADPPEAIRELGRRSGVTVNGSVPDVRPYVTRAALTVAPLENRAAAPRTRSSNHGDGRPGWYASRQAVAAWTPSRASTCWRMTARRQLSRPCCDLARRSGGGGSAWRLPVVNACSRTTAVEFHAPGRCADRGTVREASARPRNSTLNADQTAMKISIFGLGYVVPSRWPVSRVTATRSWGVDLDPLKLALIRSGSLADRQEGNPELTGRWSERKGSRSPTTWRAVRSTRLSFICVGTPVQPERQQDLAAGEAGGRADLRGAQG